MSRIGKAAVEFPKGVEIKVDDTAVVAKGPKGSVRIPLAGGISAKLEGNKVHVERAEDTKLLRAMHGTTRALINNAVEGVTKGFSKKLEIVGVGYKAVLKGKQLSLDVGFANTLTVTIPDGITLNLPDPNHVEVVGIDKQLVGQVAADIRASRRPEPYKGKGVRYIDEVVRRKAGKATTATAKK